MGARAFVVAEQRYVWGEMVVEQETEGEDEVTDDLSSRSSGSMVGIEEEL